MSERFTFTGWFRKKMREYTLAARVNFFRKLNNYLTESQQQYLISRLKSFGQNSSLYMPIYISGAENVEIGDNVSIAAYVHMWGEGGIKIGNRVMIASHTAITSLTHDYHKEAIYKTLIKGSVTIEDDVWIGSHSVILPEIKIGKGSVIGAGSVVTKDVQPYSIVFGSPARHYKFREVKEHEEH